jgi:hypothetical protein
MRVLRKSSGRGVGRVGDFGSARDVESDDMGE